MKRKTQSRDPIRIVLLADHTIGYKVVEFLLEQTKKDFTICKIYTNPADGKWWKSLGNLSKKYNIEILNYSNSEELFNSLKNISFDYILTLSWKYLLPANIIALPRLGAVNLHYSLLPKHRGVYPINWAIMSGDLISGISFHFIGNSIDNGDIIAQAIVDILPSHTSYDLLQVLDKQAFQLFKQIWKKKNKWRKIARAAEGISSYHSYKDFNKSNLLDLNKQMKAIDFINLLRGKTFAPHENNMYFIDPKTHKKIFINIQLIPDNK